MEGKEKVHGIAAKITDELINSCNPEEIGQIVSTVLINLHERFKGEIDNSKNTLKKWESDYSDFLNNVTTKEI